METLKKKAYAIAEDMNLDNQVRHLTFDPMMIMTIVGALVQIFKAYQECRKTAEEAVESIQNPGVLERWRLRRIVKKSIDDDEMHEHMGGRMVRSTLKVGKTATVEEVQQIYEEV